MWGLKTRQKNRMRKDTDYTGLRRYAALSLSQVCLHVRVYLCAYLEACECVHVCLVCVQLCIFVSIRGSVFAKQRYVCVCLRVVAVYCIMLQCIAVCCNVLQSVALCVWLSHCQFGYLSCLYACLSTCLSDTMSIHLSICVCLFLSVCLYVCLSVCICNLFWVCIR